MASKTHHQVDDRCQTIIANNNVKKERFGFYTTIFWDKQHLKKLSFLPLIEFPKRFAKTVWLIFETLGARLG